jgi:hypothetical protein
MEDSTSQTLSDKHLAQEHQMNIENSEVLLAIWQNTSKYRDSIQYHTECYHDTFQYVKKGKTRRGTRTIITPRKSPKARVKVTRRGSFTPSMLKRMEPSNAPPPKAAEARPKASILVV